MKSIVNQDQNAYLLALRRLYPTLVVVGLFSVAVNLLMLTGPMFMLQLYDRVLSSGSVATLQGLFVIVVAAYFFLGLYDLLRNRMLSRAAFRLDQLAGTAGFDVWLRSGMTAHGTMPRPLNDLATVRGFLSSPAMTGFFDIPWIPLFLAIIFFIHTWLGLLALGGAVVVTIMALANQFATQRRFAQAMSMDSAESYFTDQVHRNGNALIPLGMADKLSRYWKDMHTAGLATGQTASERTEIYTAFSKAFRLLLQSALLALGGYLALKQEISPGMIVATSIIAGRALAPVDQVIGQWRNVVRAREAHKRLKVSMEGSGGTAQRVELPDPVGQLSVRGLTKFAPGQINRTERPPIVQEIGFDLAPGDALGIIGPSASGKSTLARLLVGAWPADSGEIRLDGATLDQWTSEVLGRFVGYLPQTLELLAGTIRDNIVRFDPNASDDDLIAASRLAGVHEMILKLPDGYNTRLEYGAPILSGGQTQRIGLARALYGMPKLVVLDEPNSNLDADGDEALTQAIAQMRQAGSTVVVMAHRPSAIASVNKLMVLNDGRVADFGDKAEVLRRATRAAPPATAQAV
ncbi:MAG: type I secretion system permease/ATPase [Roseibium sp.]|uniref:type I secretion system permease/ATPase n=1 Tax=Roseibium sp. TaxID=1936156 RepID=UPI0026028501|nr:type I secretion system permease/ATPase [Roseibium sp.]MCV0426019.1 type I secretion system permease/ATPase [Roseibium sp.]